jgi:3-oxoacyl-[acyl-carrier-protein] synthase III
MQAFIRGVEVHLPEAPVSNQDLVSWGVDTNDEWVRSRTGIEQRYVFDRADKDLKSSDIATIAARKVLEKCGISVDEIDGIIVGSMYPDQVFPSTACVVQNNLGCINAFAYDVVAACAFIPFAINQASLMIQAGQAKNILVIGAELSSRVINWEDRNTCVLFGDGAGAILVSASENETDGNVLWSELKSDGRAQNILTLTGPGTEYPYIQMEGQAVFKIAVTEMAAIVKKALNKLNLTTADLNLVVPHQANIRILNATKEKLGLTDEQVFVNVQKYGNTSSASVPLALYEAEKAGRLKKGDLIATVAIGAGMTWGCNIIRW